MLVWTGDFSEILSTIADADAGYVMRGGREHDVNLLSCRLDSQSDGTKPNFLRRLCYAIQLYPPKK